MTSALRNFNRSSIEKLIGEGVEMKYDRSLIKMNFSGLWRYNQSIVCINPTVRKQKGKVVEDIVIVHEWLHAYEDILLDLENDFRETQIEWYAHFHLRRDQYIAEYARSFYPEFRIP